MLQKLNALLFCLLVSGSVVWGQDSTATQTPRKQKTGIAAIPMLNYNRTQGFVAGALLSYYYKINKKDTISPSSSTGMIGMYTQEKSYALMTFSQLYFAEDRWRVQGALGVMDINFQFYLDNPSIATGNFYDYSSKASFISLQVQRNIFKRVYLGPTATFVKSTTTYGVSDLLGKDSITVNSLNNVGYIISNDTRDHVQYPTRGMFMTFKNQFYRDWIGSDHAFERYTFAYNQFAKLSKKSNKQVLVIRTSLNIAAGNVPFEGQTVVGGDDIRGYSQGRYRNDQVYTLQAEYRWNFYKRWGFVAFAGLASAVKHVSDIPDSELLPGVGAGLRWKMLPSERINIGIDGGWGKDDYSITFRIGESFGR
jgi:outer membrane protein assembly factor BamA